MSVKETGYAVYSTWVEFVGDDGVLNPTKICPTKQEAWNEVYICTNENFSNIKLTWREKIYHCYNNFRARLHLRTHYPGVATISDCECWVAKVYVNK